MYKKDHLNFLAITEFTEKYPGLSDDLVIKTLLLLLSHFDANFGVLKVFAHSHE